MKPLAAVILAAGDGTRMLSRIPKVVHSLYGKPLIGHVLDAVRHVGIRRIVVVVGYRSELVRGQLGAGVETVVQRSLKGTGHAVAQAMPRLRGFRGDVLVLYGDTPLLTPQTLKGLIEAHRREKAVCTLLTAQLKEPIGYGRIVSISVPFERLPALKEMIEGRRRWRHCDQETGVTRAPLTPPASAGC